MTTRLRSDSKLLPLLSRAFALRVAPFFQVGLLTAEDVFAVDICAAGFGEGDVDVLLGLAFSARGPRVGQVGVDLRRVAASAAYEGRGEQIAALPWPKDLETWQRAVLASSLCGEASARRPFVAQRLASGAEPLDSAVLVMPRRMAREQLRVAAALAARVAAAPAPTLAPADVEAALTRLYGDAVATSAAEATRVAAQRALTVVVGGPGTGKTYGVTRTLALLLELGGPALRIALAAPTGKAAVRMKEAIAENLQRPATAGGLTAPDVVRAAIAELSAQTLHRLLGVRPDGSVRHGGQAPLAFDVVVVDEVSMVDLTMMRMLLEALAPQTRLILLGDRDQLASVEAGTVLADFVTGNSALAGCVVGLTVSRRFANAPTIATIAAALQGDGAGANAEAAALDVAVAAMCGEVEVAGETDPMRVQWLDRDEAEGGHERLIERLAAPYRQALFLLIADDLQREGDAALRRLAEPARQVALLLGLEQYRVLATHRAGHRGVEGLVVGLEKRARAWLQRASAQLPSAGAHWLGRPVLITRNDAAVGLMNGDVGLVLPCGEQLGLAAVFLDRGGVAPRPFAVPLSRLPSHEGAMAMTVHKSQGSQFHEVGLVLADGDSPIQTRELIYTAITRASSQLRWSGDRAVLRAALSRRVARASGLARLLAAEQKS